MIIIYFKVLKKFCQRKKGKPKSNKKLSIQILNAVKHFRNRKFKYKT